jgi:hypothetical protein
MSTQAKDEGAKKKKISFLEAPLKPTIRDRVLQVACVFAMIGLGLMVWSVLDPTWFPIILGLSVGQGIGTFSFLLYLIVLVADLGIRRRMREQRGASAPPTAMNVAEAASVEVEKAS